MTRETERETDREREREREREGEREREKRRGRRMVAMKFCEISVECIVEERNNSLVDD